MNREIKPFPKDLAGKYKVSFSELTLTPIYLSNSLPLDRALKHIGFEDGICKAIFLDGSFIALALDYSEYEYLYKFQYHNITHVFQVKANLAGLIYEVDMDMMIDFSLND